jgi:hypothetical protein
VATQGRIKKALNAANAAPARGGRTALIDVICKGQISLVGPIRHTPTLLDLVEEPLDEIMRAIQASKSALFDFVSAECWPTRHTLHKLAANYLAFVKLAAIRIWLRAYESTALINRAA